MVADAERPEEDGEEGGLGGEVSPYRDMEQRGRDDRSIHGMATVY
jgi:hypothetical protein